MNPSAQGLVLDVDLPEGWTHTTIGHVTVPKVAQGGPRPSSKFNYIDISSIDNDGKLITAPKTIETKNAPSRARQNVLHQDVLISMTRPNLNAVALVGPELDGAIASTGFEVLRATNVDSKWLFLVARSQSFVDSMSELVQGALYPAIRPRDIRDYSIPLPPPAEQKRIVAKVEGLLTRVNAARERLAKAPALIKRLRQSILAAACTGQLTGRAGDQEIPTGWKLSRLDSLFEIRTGGTPDRKRSEFFCNGTIPWVRTTEVQNCDIYKTGEKITKLGLENSSAKIFPPSTLLVALYGEGKTRGQVARLKIPAATNQACSALINPNMPDITNRYVFWRLRCDYDRLREQSAGGNQPNLSNGLIKAWEIAIPPIGEQGEIVRRVEALFALADKIEARVHAAMARVEKITQSILTRAFRGELVPTEAELARQEGRDYETAETLLARLNAGEMPSSPSRSRPVAATVPAFTNGLFGEINNEDGESVNGIARSLSVLRSRWKPIPHGTPPFEDVLVDAFKSVCRQNSPDRVVADPELHRAFVERCRKVGLQTPEFDLCFSLLNLRKSNEMKNLHSKRRPVMNQWRYAGASEIAARVVYWRHGLTVDRIISHPKYAQEFEQVARSITPGFTSFEYRWAALGLRKVGKNAAQGVVDRLRWSDPLSFLALSGLPDAEGVYALSDDVGWAFVYGTKNIRKSIAAQASLGNQNLFGDGLWRLDPQRIVVKYAKSAVGVTARQGIVNTLIQTWKPVLNVPRAA